MNEARLPKNRKGMLDNRPAELISWGRRRAKIGWATYTIFRFLDGNKEIITLSGAQSIKRFRY